MLVGFYIFKGDGSTQYSPSFPRQGLAATFLAQALQRVGTTPSLTIGVEHRNRDETSFVNASSFGAITNSGNPQTLDISALKEEIRFSYTLTATNAWEGFLINILAPAWRPS